MPEIKPPGATKWEADPYVPVPNSNQWEAPLDESELTSRAKEGFPHWAETKVTPEAETKSRRRRGPVDTAERFSMERERMGEESWQRGKHLEVARAVLRHRIRERMEKSVQTD